MYVNTFKPENFKTITMVYWKIYFTVLKQQTTVLLAGLKDTILVNANILTY